MSQSPSRKKDKEKKGEASCFKISDGLTDQGGEKRKVKKRRR